MVRYFFVIIIVFIAFSCNSKYVKFLEDGTFIPSDSLFFQKNYRVSKEIVFPKEIDTNSVYLEIYYLYGSKQVKYTNDSYLFKYRFYTSGAVNKFKFSDNRDKNLSKYYNPDLTGLRGICFKENDKFFLDILAKSSELNTIGVYKYEF